MNTLVVCLLAALPAVLTLTPSNALARSQTQSQSQTAPPAATPAPAADAAPTQADMAAMMDRAKKFTEPGPSHKALERFVGTWATETQFIIAGKPTPAEKGTAEFSWQLPGRWMKQESSGPFMGRPTKTFALFGYDNFRQSFVMTTVSTMDTAMNHAEGDMDPGGKVLIMYGPLDEYLTGEVAKMVKYVWRFESKDRIVFEVHDLPIGEANTQVVQITYTRQS